MDRRAAVLNAYHYGSDLAESGVLVASLSRGVAAEQARIAGLDEAIAAGGEAGKAAAAYKEHLAENSVSSVMGLASVARGMDRAAVMLKQRFGLAAEVVQKDATGAGRFTGFEVRSEQYGLLMSVDAKGAMTLYDANGKGYSAETYNQANTDATIPELSNDLTRQAAEQSRIDALLTRAASQSGGSVQR